MAQTTWKQVVLDTADAYREANGTTDKIPVGELANKVRAGAGTPYEGDNPLTIGQAGYNFPAKTLLKDGLQIINGVNGEDLTDTVADQTTAVTELMKMVSRKIAMNNGEGQYVWKKLTAEGGEFIDFVVSSDTEAYPNGAVHADGYWYELVEEGVDLSEIGLTGIACGTFTVSSAATKLSEVEIVHNLGVIPKLVAVFIVAGSLPTSSATNYFREGVKYPSIDDMRFISCGPITSSTNRYDGRCSSTETTFHLVKQVTGTTGQYYAKGCTYGWVIAG